MNLSNPLQSQDKFLLFTLIRPSSLQPDNCCVSAFRAQAGFSLLLTFPPLLLSITSASSSALSFFHFFFFPSSALSFFCSPLTPLCPLLQLPLIVLLQTAPRCRWMYLPCSLYRHGHARSQTEAELLNEAAAGEISAQLHYWGKKNQKNWQISSKTTVLKREQGVQIKDSVC